MTKYILIIVTAVGLHAQTSHFQPPSWISSRGASHSTALWQPDGQSGPFLNRPFTGTEVRHTTQVLADGTHVDHADTSKFYRDAQGRMRNESPSRVQIYDPVAGCSYTLELESKTYEKTPRHSDNGGDYTYSMAVVGSLIVSGGEDGPHSKPAPRPNEEELSPQIMNGISVRGSRVTTTIPAGAFGNDRPVKVVNERWYSDDLKALVKSTNNDPRFGLSTYELTNIVEAPPDPALFQVPPDFTLKASHSETPHPHGPLH